MSTPFWKQLLLTNTFIVDERGGGSDTSSTPPPFCYVLDGGTPLLNTQKRSQQDLLQARYS